MRDRARPKLRQPWPALPTAAQHLGKPVGKIELLDFRKQSYHKCLAEREGSVRIPPAPPVCRLDGFGQGQSGPPFYLLKMGFLWPRATRRFGQVFPPLDTICQILGKLWGKASALHLEKDPPGRRLGEPADDTQHQKAEPSDLEQLGGTAGLPNGIGVNVGNLPMRADSSLGHISNYLVDAFMNL